MNESTYKIHLLLQVWNEIIADNEHKLGKLGESKFIHMTSMEGDCNVYAHSSLWMRPTRPDRYNMRMVYKHSFSKSYSSQNSHLQICSPMLVLTIFVFALLFCTTLWYIYSVLQRLYQIKTIYFIMYTIRTWYLVPHGRNCSIQIKVF